MSVDTYDLVLTGFFIGVGIGIGIGFFIGSVLV